MLTRTIPGWCNNLQNPYWGASLLPFRRLLRPAYANGVDSPRGDGANQFLPRPRDVSFPLHNIRDPTLAPNDGITLLVMQFGQFLDHDMFITPEKEGVVGCCDDFVTISTSDPECRPIDVSNDPFYDQFGVKCLQFIRSTPVNPSCSGAPYREQQNNLTAYLDGSQIYGSTYETSDELRDETDPALLKISNFVEDTCTETCPLNFLPIRANEEGEPEFFGEVRRVVSAVFQQITYNEFLPIVIGTEATRNRNINIVQDGYWETRYDPTIDATAPNVFAAALFRFGHTLIPDIFNLPNNVQVLLARSFFNHRRTITSGSSPSDFIRGIASHFAQKYDHIMVDSIVNKLFAEEPFNFGADLLARNIMRAREHGIPGYNAWRSYANLKTFSSFDELRTVMSDPVVDFFAKVYRSVDDIDLFPAMISENQDGKSLVGPLLRELFGELFQRLKFGDRFWFENYNQPRPFTKNQLASIRRTLMSSLICAYTDATHVQRYAMYAVSANNPLIPCSELLKTGIIYDIRQPYWHY
ncbi:Peroxidasin [Armadillidium nasatum]|uniref:Peroxidasin n=1 Tax=Armadillidium nasatum TaxID=96803 RepID=A0A5N5T365_9CRUS|nr:Peroxidasin [Armadillidium nasatum]